MNSVYQEINDGLRAELRQRLGRQRFRLWFRDTTVVGVDESSVTLAVPNEVHCAWLQYTFGVELQEACDEVLGEGVRVCLKVSPEQERRRVVRERLPDRPQDWDELLARRRLPPTLDTFVSGAAGRFPVMILKQLLEGGAARDARVFYLYGDCGAGKTHLLQGLEADMGRRRPGSALYLSARRFTQRYVNALRSREVEALRAFETDLLARRLVLLDDLDELAARPATQEALVRLQERCFGGDTRFVLAGRQHPAALEGFSDRLRSRIRGGVVLSVPTADPELLDEILADRSQRMGCRAPDDVRRAIAERTVSVRGAVMMVERWAAVSSGDDAPLDVEWLAELAPTVAATAREEVVQRVKDVVAEHFGLARTLLDQPTKIRTAQFPRRVAMYLVYRACALPLSQLGQVFGLRSHSSVSRAIHEMRALRSQDAAVEQLVDGLLARL
ncbi:MAG: DnaA/Hda family protein [Planctomycetota bacterium]|nr:DnaA/Hda family protein [Planctomycetota bacterium]